jgi:hypothetical protein
MSYDIRLKDPKTGETATAPEKHSATGGTYVVGGTSNLWLNVTWNYGKHFRRVMGEKGIRTIYGMSGEESIPVLEEAMEQLDPESRSDDYWEATEGNARAALENLLSFARMRPDCIWGGG